MKVHEIFQKIGKPEKMLGKIQTLFEMPNGRVKHFMKWQKMNFIISFFVFRNCVAENFNMRGRS